MNSPSIINCTEKISLIAKTPPSAAINPHGRLPLSIQRKIANRAVFFASAPACENSKAHTRTKKAWPPRRARN